MALHLVRCALLVGLVTACEPIPTPAVGLSAGRAGAAPLVVGETLVLDSKILAERRVINVYLPPGYAKGADRYPVLYMPDGGLTEDFHHIMGLVDVSVKNETMRPFIVVGIENTERRRDLTGVTTVAEEQALAPHAGGSDTFRRFLREELKPHIAARYRVTAESAIVGESLAGLFVIETLLVDPELFDTYVAVSASTWWNHAALVRGASARFATWSARPKTFFYATAEEDETLEGWQVLVTALREQKPKGLVWHYAPMPEEKHGTIFHPAALRGFRIVFAPPKK
jgi:predicted alpha/beta superfamily hydrolase